MNSVVPSSRDSVAPVDRALNQAFLVVTYAPDGRIRSANFRFLRLFGCNLSEIVGQDASRFLSKSTSRTRLAEQWAHLAAGASHTEVGLWVATGGREIWLESRYVPVHDAAGAIEAVVQLAEDVTARVERDAEATGQTAAIQRTYAVVHFSLDGRVQWANDRYLAATGYTRAEAVGALHEELVEPSERGSVEYQRFWSELRAGRPQAGEFRRVRKDGSDLWVQAVYTPILDPAGRAIKVVKYATDVTEAKLRQADYEWQITAIRQSNCVVTFDLSGAVLDANDLFLDAVGYTLDEVRGAHHRIFVKPAYVHSREYTSFWSDLRRGQHRAGLFQRVGKDGRELWLQATYNPIFDASGRPVKVVKYATVVTDDRLLQAEHQGQIAAIHHSHCVASFALDGTVLDANENFLAALGYRFSEVRGRAHALFLADADDDAELWRDLARGQHRAGEFRFRSRDGREIWLQASYNPIFDLNGRVFKVVQYAADVTQEKLQRADVQGQIEAIQKSQDVLVLGLDGTILDVNERLLATFGYTRDELVGRHHDTLADRDASAGFWQALAEGQHQSGLYRRLAKGGREVWVQATYDPILDLSGRPFKIVMFGADVSANVALAEAYAEAKREAHLDGATSLPNRAKLTGFLASHLANAGATLALFYLDLDDFGRVNAEHGASAGDRALVEVADRLRRMLAADQMVARFGGDEFVIAAPGMGADAAERFSQLVLDRVSAPIVGPGDQEIHVTASIGVALAPPDGATPDELVRAADSALATAKQKGGGRAFASSELDAKLVGQRRLVEEMRNSIVAGDFYLEYQPRFDARTQAIHSVEALVRWSHPERGRISPMEFVPLAERTGLIVPLSDWILQRACHAASRWGGIGVSVNLSPVQFHDDDLVRKVSAALAASGLAPHLLELEVTEGVLVSDSRRALEVLEALKAIGVRLAIDDFGTGYSSLSYLRNFPFDVIKIDRSFVRDLGAPKSSRPIVQAILALGRALGLSVTAEGVETQAQLEILVSDGCDEVQGYLLAMPSPPEEIDKIAARRTVAA